MTLPLRTRADLGARVAKRYSGFPQSSNIAGTAPSDCLVSYRMLVGGESYGFAEKQSVYSAAPSDWAIISYVNVFPLFCLAAWIA